MSNESCCGGSSCCGESTPAVGTVTPVTGTLSSADRLARLRFRTGISRMNLTVPPGLYALGSPGPDDPVLVTANFRLSFDAVRAAMKDRRAWIMVLDTKGINVWCAAGKGTFGTDELVERITAVGLADTVSHRRLILPQLGAPGVAAHEVQRRTGFRVHYGPVDLGDLPAYLDAGMKASPDMRFKDFPLSERLELTGIELVQSWKAVLAIAAISGLLSLIFHGTGGVTFIHDLLPALLAVMGGAFLTPLLLPWIPGRAFALKGGLIGSLLAVTYILLFSPPPAIALFTLTGVTAASSFLAMNFTGATTFTSPSGVKKEMRIGVPVQLGLITLAVTGRVALELIHKSGGGL